MVTVYASDLGVRQYREAATSHTAIMLSQSQTRPVARSYGVRERQRFSRVRDCAQMNDRA
jgi:hypothetical protein